MLVYRRFTPKKVKINKLCHSVPCHSVPGTLWRVYQLYGLTEEELDFIIRSALPLASSKNYDIKYRMGDELGEDGKSSSTFDQIPKLI